jgi:uncharacterized DUF497 family protein
VFEWDARKATINAEKHGVTFDDAATVFEDPAALTGPARTTIEARFVLLGRAHSRRVLVVVFTLRGTYAESIRLISARQANRRERHTYASAQD